MNVSTEIKTINSSAVVIGQLKIHFSYKTPIAFADRRGDFVARENDWSATTAKHLRRCGSYNKDDRVDGDTFERLLDAAIKYEVMSQIGEEPPNDMRLFAVAGRRRK